ncbi:MAG: phosphoesterase, partial [Gammaproteobacteria bacterium]
AVTVLKAFFKGDYVIPSPKQASADGLSLVDYTGPALTVEGELNKLASNISLGRDTAGVHYRSDGDLGMLLGEELAISVLQELVNGYNQNVSFSFNRFDGTPVTISKQY